MKKLLILFIFFAIACHAFAIEPNWALYGAQGHNFNNGLAWSYSTSNRLSGYINANGELAIPYKFKFAGDFTRGTAIVSDENSKEGIIDINGNYTLPPGDYAIYPFREEAPGFYRIQRNSDNKVAFFDGHKFLTDFKYDYIDFNGIYPFLSLSSHDPGVSESGVMNVLTGEFYPKSYCYELGDLGIAISDASGKFALFSFEGEPKDDSTFSVSMKGSEVYFDSISGLYGLRNSISKGLIVSPKYKLPKKTIRNYLWINNTVLLYDSISPSIPYASVILNQDGRELFRQDSDTITYSIGMDFIESYNPKQFTNDNFRKYYDFRGNELESLRGEFWVRIVPGIYRSSESDRLYFVKDNTFKNNVRNPRISDNYIIYTNPQSNKSYIYSLTNKTEFGPYNSVSLKGFRDGIIIVSDDNGNYLVDTKGREYRYSSSIDIEDDCISEGVFGAYDKANSIYGFIYNPLGHQGWNYNQKSGDISDYAFRNLWDRANTLFSEKKYAQAMDIYGQLMILRPQETAVFDNYAACLYNLNYLDEALTAINVSLEQWPNNEYALNLKDKILNSIESQKEIEVDDDEENYEQNSSSVWDVIGSFANAMMNIAGQYNTDYYNPQYSISGSSPSYSSTSGNYETQYRNWERRAESNYNSLTNTGYSTTSRSGKKHGGTGQGVSSGKYVQMKRSLREAQREMRNIRQKAARAGIQISKSYWEDASVGY